MSWGTVGQWRTLSGNRVAPVITLTPDTVFIGLNEAIPLPAVVAVDDLDGDVSYKINGPTGTIDNAVNGVGTYQYMVSDTEGNTATAEFTVYVGPQAPVARAGDNLSVDGGQGFTLDFTQSSDVDGEIVNYGVTQIAGDTVTLDRTNPALPTGIAPIKLTAQTLSFLLTVTDDSGLTSTDEVSVEVAAVEGPIANAGADQSVAVGDVFYLDFSASIAGAAAIQAYELEQTSGSPLALDYSNPVQPFGVPLLSNANENLEFQLTVVDGNGFTSTDTVKVGVTASLDFFIKAVDFSSDGLEWEVEHDPKDIELYPIALSKWLNGDSVVNVNYEFPTDSGIELLNAFVLGGTVAPMLSGGNIGTHDISVTITTNTGRQRNRKIRLRVKDL